MDSVFLMRILIFTWATVITKGLNLFDVDLNIYIDNSNYKRTQSFDADFNIYIGKSNYKQTQSF